MITMSKLQYLIISITVCTICLILSIGYVVQGDMDGAVAFVSLSMANIIGWLSKYAENNSDNDDESDDNDQS